MKYSTTTCVALMAAYLANSPALAQQTEPDSEQAADAKRAKSIQEILVVGTPQSRYIAGDTDPTSGLDLEFLENPRNAIILPEQLILDRKITDLNEALRAVPSFAEGDGFGGTNDDYSLRGFRRNVVYRNGFRRASNFRTNLTNVEYTQVIRGAASITYGQVEPGGLVDIVTKKPLEETRLAAEVRYGRFNDGFVLADWSQKINDKAALRLVASKQDSENFRDYYDIARDTVALSARYDFSPQTSLNASYEWRDERRPLDRGTITVPINAQGDRRIVNELVDVPISRRFGEPFEIFETQFQFYETTLKHAFDEDWSLEFNAAYEQSDADDLQARPRQAIIFAADAPITDDGFFTGGTDLRGALAGAKGFYEGPSDRIFLRRGVDGNRNSEAEVSYFSAVMKGEFTLGSVANRLAIGIDHRDLESSDERYTGFFSDGGAIPLLNIEQPVYGAIPVDINSRNTFSRNNTEEDSGIYVNNYVEFTSQLGMLLGVRYSEASSTAKILGNSLPGSEADALSPQVGFSYTPTENVSLFASYTESFEPNGIVMTGDSFAVFDPETGEQVELGVKAEWFDGGLQTTLLGYKIEKANVLSVENGEPVLNDGQTSEGFEFNAVGQPIQGMNLIASYAYTDAELPEQGTRPYNVAEHTFNLYGSYEVQSGAWEGLGFGGGVFHSGDRYGDSSNTWKLGSYSLVDASAWYSLAAPSLLDGAGRVRLQFAVKNLLNEDYYAASGGDLRVSLGAPRTYTASISIDL